MNIWFWNVGGDSSCFMLPSPPAVCSSSGSLILNGKQDSEVTQRLLHTQEPRVTQPLVNDVICGPREGSRMFFLENRADRGLFSNI